MDSTHSADLNLGPELKATLPGAKANLTLLMYLTSPAAKLDALDQLIKGQMIWKANFELFI